MTRIAAARTAPRAARGPSPKAELKSLQDKVAKQFASPRAREVKALSAAQLRGAERLLVSQGVDRSISAYAVGGKLYAAFTGLTGIARWVELPASDLKRFEALKKDLGAAAHKLPAAKWSSEGPRFLNGSDALNVTPRGELGVGYQAYVLGREVWLARTPVAPGAQTRWVKL